MRIKIHNVSTSYDRVAEKLKCYTVFNWELKMKPNRFEEMREEMKEQLEREMENKQNETFIFLEPKVGLKLFQISIFVVI